MDKDKQLITQDNLLTESRYSFSRYEKNALYVVIRNVRTNYIENPDFDGEYDDLDVYIAPWELGDIADAAHKKNAKEALMSLRRKSISLEKEDGSWLDIGFINWAEYNAENDVYCIEVSKKLLPYLVNLTEKFTTYDLTVAISLKSRYSQRFYEICCQYKNLKVFHYSLKDLRNMFCLQDQYKKAPDFIRRVIDVAQKELKAKYDEGQCNIYFDYMKKDGTRGENSLFDFKIYTKEEANAKKNDLEKAKDMQTKLIAIHRTLSAYFKRDKKYVERVVKALAFNPENITPIFEKLQRIINSYKSKDVPPVIRYALANDYDIK